MSVSTPSRHLWLVVIMATLGVASMGCAGILWVASQAVSQRQATFADLTEEQQLDQELGVLARVGKLVGIDVEEELDDMTRAGAALMELQAEIAEAEADGTITQEEAERIQWHMEELDGQTNRWGATMAARGAPEPEAAGRAAPTDVETIALREEESSSWVPPAWLVAGGVGALVLSFGLMASGWILMTSASDEDEPVP